MHDQLESAVRQASVDLQDRLWAEAASDNIHASVEAHWIFLLRELAEGHVPNRETLGYAWLQMPSIEKDVAEFFSQKFKINKLSPKIGRPNKQTLSNAEKFILYSKNVPPSLKILTIGMLQGIIKQKRGRPKSDSFIREAERFAVEASFKFYLEGNSIEGRPDRSKFRGSDKDWAIFETSQELGMSVEKIRDILYNRKGW